MDNIKHWLRGLLGAALEGLFVSLIYLIGDYTTFHLGGGFLNMLEVVGASTIGRAAIWGFKHPFPVDDGTVEESNTITVSLPIKLPDIKNVKLIGFLIPLLLIQGCAGSHYAELPTTASSGDKNAAIIADAREWLSSPAHQKMIHDLLPPIGKLAINHAVSDEDKQDIRNELFSVSNAFTSLATGQFVSPEEVNKTIESFNTEIDSSKYSDFTDEANLLWVLVYGNLKLVNDPSLTKTWLLILADAAQKAAE